MKKLFAILLTVAMLASMATVASAASTTTLTTTVPAASYTLNIPADQEINFGDTYADIGELTVSNASGFAEGKNLKVTISYSDFACEDVSTTIPMRVHANYENLFGNGTLISSGDALAFKGHSNGTVLPNRDNDGNNLNYLAVAVSSTDWGKALAGEYTATITFIAEVVAE